MTAAERHVAWKMSVEMSACWLVIVKAEDKVVGRLVSDMLGGGVSM